jgi:hypothetical protein
VHEIDAKAVALESGSVLVRKDFKMTALEAFEGNFWTSFAQFTVNDVTEMLGTCTKKAIITAKTIMTGSTQPKIKQKQVLTGQQSIDVHIVLLNYVPLKKH